jgi:hypothetical protein
MMTVYLLFTALTSLALIIGLPAAFLRALLDLRSKRDLSLLLRVVTVAVGFVAGMMVAWSVATIDMRWPFPLWETLRATVHSDIYGHEVEHAAESIVIFVLFGGDIGAIVATIAGWLISKRRLRPVDIS